MATATAKAAEKEVKQKHHTISFKGKRYTLPPTIEMMPVDVLEAYEAEHWASFVHGMLGEKQWASFKSTEPVIKDLNELAAEIDKVYGAAEEEE